MTILFKYTLYTVLIFMPLSKTINSMEHKIITADLTNGEQGLNLLVQNYLDNPKPLSILIPICANEVVQECLPLLFPENKPANNTNILLYLEKIYTIVQGQNWNRMQQCAFWWCIWQGNGLNRVKQHIDLFYNTLNQEVEIHIHTDLLQNKLGPVLINNNFCKIVKETNSHSTEFTKVKLLEEQQNGENTITLAIWQESITFFTPVEVQLIPTKTDNGLLRIMGDDNAYWSPNYNLVLPKDTISSLTVTVGGCALILMSVMIKYFLSWIIRYHKFG